MEHITLLISQMFGTCLLFSHLDAISYIQSSLHEVPFGLWAMGIKLPHSRSPYISELHQDSFREATFSYLGYYSRTETEHIGSYSVAMVSPEV